MAKSVIKVVILIVKCLRCNLSCWWASPAAHTNRNIMAGNSSEKSSWFSDALLHTEYSRTPQTVAESPLRASRPFSSVLLHFYIRALKAKLPLCATVRYVRTCWLLRAYILKAARPLCHSCSIFVPGWPTILSSTGTTAALCWVPWRV